ncbi:hypothetical protein KEM52_002119, partial [Ascosphaera acerosa]
TSASSSSSSSSSSSPSSTGPHAPADADIRQPLHSFLMSLSMIVFSEIGDKTFLVAALMAMRHSRMPVFTAAFSALFTMTVLSALLGHAVPTLLPVTFTNFLAAGLFFVFGVRMVFEAKGMAPDDNAAEEMREVERELEQKDRRARRRRASSIAMADPYSLEAGRSKEYSGGIGSPASSASSSRSPSPAAGARGARGASPLKTICRGVSNLLSLLLSPAWVQTFVMTFLAEWGDRSQIATIAMAAGTDYWFVTWGAVIGHGICTGAAVLGGRAIAGRVSMRLGGLPSPPPLPMFIACYVNSRTNELACSDVWRRHRVPHLRSHLPIPSALRLDAQPYSGRTHHHLLLITGYHAPHSLGSSHHHMCFPCCTVRAVSRASRVARRLLDTDNGVRVDVKGRRPRRLPVLPTHHVFPF